MAKLPGVPAGRDHGLMRVLFGLTSLWLTACTGADAPPAPPPPPAVPKAEAPQAPAASAQKVAGNPAEAGGCTLLSVPVPPHRHAGKARIRIEGAGLSAEGEAQPAVCGAYWALDQDVLGKPVKAGEGMLFETCLPEGLFQVSSDDEAVGKRNLATREPEARARALFNPKAGGSFAFMRPAKNDEIVIDEGRRSAHGRLTLSNFAGGGDLRVEFTFDCR